MGHAIFVGAAPEARGIALERYCQRLDPAFPPFGAEARTLAIISPAHACAHQSVSRVHGETTPPRHRAGVASIGHDLVAPRQFMHWPMRSRIFAPGFASGSITRRPRVRGPTASWCAIDASCASRARGSYVAPHAAQVAIRAGPTTATLGSGAALDGFGCRTSDLYAAATSAPLAFFFVRDDPARTKPGSAGGLDARTKPGSVGVTLSSSSEAAATAASSASESV